MTVTDTSTNQGYKKPHSTNELDVDVVRLREAIDGIDVDMKAVLDALALKAASIHAHDISDVTGLTAALASKQDAGGTISLDDLSDVEASAAATNQFMRKTVGGWQPVTFTASMIYSGTIAEARLPSRLSDENLSEQFADQNEAFALSLILRR